MGGDALLTAVGALLAHHEQDVTHEFVVKHGRVPFADTVLESLPVGIGRLLWTGKQWSLNAGSARQRSMGGRRRRGIGLRHCFGRPVAGIGTERVVQVRVVVRR